MRLRRSRVAIWPLLAAAAAIAQPKPDALKARDLYYQAATPDGGSGAPKPARLGMRYNLLQVNPTSGASRAVDPDGNYKQGDCFALEFVPNRDGHLYIYNRASSGKPQLLLPSASMPDEMSLVKAGQTARVPQQYCFSLADPPGR